jgi:hypothetical protein
MKLTELLLQIDDAHLERLAGEHIKGPQRPPRHTLYGLLEGIIRNYKFVNDVVFNRQPPTLSILTALLEAPGFVVRTDVLREVAVRETARLCALLDSGEVLERGDQLRVYRRVLREARRTDIEMNASEVAVLGVLREELGVSHAEHYLLEHHAELRGYWQRDDAVLHELRALSAMGLVFERDGATALPQDLAPFVRRSLGLEMSADAARRLFALVTNADLGAALEAAGAKTSGSKEERIRRLVDNAVQPSVVLRRVALQDLKDICRETGANVSGSKEDLVERMVEHFAAGLDRVAPPEDTPPVIVPEPRVLDERRFRALFTSLRGQDLGHILEAYPDLRQSGSKETRTATLHAFPMSEATLLSNLTKLALEEILWSLDLRLAGSKSERIDRLVAHFRNLSAEQLAALEGRAAVAGEELRLVHAGSTPVLQKEGAAGGGTVSE